MYTKNKKIAAALTASVMTISCFSSMGSIYADDASSYSMNVSVNLSGEKKEISPYIYGMNDYGNTGNYKSVSVNAARQGGNRYTGYNWENNYSNAGEDWVNSSDTNIGDIKDGPAAAVQKFSARCKEYNVPYKMTTLQMAGYVAADKSGTVKEDEVAPSSRWNKVEFRKNGELSMTPDLDDGVVYMDEYVNYIINTLGDSTTSTGIQGYSLDNEPVLWNDTHPRLHPEEVTNSELVSKSIELASVVKELDPNAEVFGPAFWGMLPCIQISETDTDWQAVKGNYTWYLDYYLDQMAQAEKEHGTRLLDVIDVHYYAQDCSTDEARLQAARSLYDPTYAENSWLQPYFGQYFPFIPNIQKSIDKYYPGTKIAVSEYNLGDISNEKTTGKVVSSAIAEAEALGCFADNNVYLATYWGTLPECPYVESAINLYTNYDGEGADFGDTLVEAKTEDISKATAYAAIDGNDDSNVTMVLSNKDSSANEKATISLAGTDTNYKSAVVYAITQDHSDIRIIDVQNDISNNTVEIELPPMSVAQVVIADTETDKTVYEAPDITTKETVYNYNDLETSENGYKMIPLGDKEHLKKIIINTTCTSSSGSSWIAGGGGLCFNNLIPEGGGDAFWGNKAFSYSIGTADNIVVFDDFEFTDANSDQVKATVGDTYTELQNWWASSESDPAGGADVSVQFNTIKLVYEYDNTQTTTTTTEVTTTTTTTSTSVTTGSSVIVDPDAAYGDVNVDGKINLTDVIYLNKYIANSYQPSKQGIINANCDMTDPQINLDDTIALLKYLIKVVSIPITE